MLSLIHIRDSFLNTYFSHLKKISTIITYISHNKINTKIINPNNSITNLQIRSNHNFNTCPKDNFS
jgi:hypothetical protein